MVYRETCASPIKVRIHEIVWQTWQYLISLSAKAEEEDKLLRVLQGLPCFKRGAVSSLLQAPSISNTLVLCVYVKTSGNAMTPSAHNSKKKIQKMCVEPISVIGKTSIWFQFCWEILHFVIGQFLQFSKEDCLLIVITSEEIVNYRIAPKKPP